jgi:3-dehydroquinate dehydratase-2
MKILVIHGPNLNRLGQRDVSIYGEQSLEQINKELEDRAKGLGAELIIFQSNSEGQLIDFLQARSPQADGIIINPAALTHYGYSLRDALADAALPTIEVHLSNIYAREKWRACSVISPVARGQISGLGWQGYLFALDALVGEKKPSP